MTAPRSDYFVTVPVPLAMTAPPISLRLYCLLATHLNPSAPGTEVWPSRKRLAEMADVSVNAIDRALPWLVENGWVTVTPRYDDAGDRTSNLYAVHGSQVGQVPTETGPRVPTETERRVAAEVREEVEPLEVNPDGSNPPSPPGQLAVAEAAPPPGGRKEVELFMEAYLEWRSREGHAPPTRSVATVLRSAVRDALSAGVPRPIVATGLRDWTDHGNHPKSVAAFIDARARGRVPGQTTPPADGWSQRVTNLVEWAEGYDQQQAAGAAGAGVPSVAPPAGWDLPTQIGAMPT